MSSAREDAGVEHFEPDLGMARAQETAIPLAHQLSEHVLALRDGQRPPFDLGHQQPLCIVVAKDHNPTILNPDFLDRQKIVPEAWGWKMVGPPITIPPFATVSYDSGVTVSVKINRLQILDKSFRGPLESSKWSVPDSRGPRMRVFDT